MEASIDTLDIIKIAAGSSVLTTLFSAAISYGLQERRASANARYLALQLSVVLEAFALACHRVVVDHENFDRSDGNYGKEHDAFPELTTYPENADWQALPRDLLSRVLNFRNEIKFSELRIKSQIDLDDSALPETLSEECAHRGSDAIRIAKDLRSRYRLAEMNADYDIGKLLGNRHEVFQELSKMRRE